MGQVSRSEKYLILFFRVDFLLQLLAVLLPVNYSCTSFTARGKFVIMATAYEFHFRNILYFSSFVVGDLAL